jgi:hypothetical protein
MYGKHILKETYSLMFGLSPSPFGREMYPLICKTGLGQLLAKVLLRKYMSKKSKYSL